MAAKRRAARKGTSAGASGAPEAGATGLFFNWLYPESEPPGELVDLRALTWNRLGPFLRGLQEAQGAVVLGVSPHRR